jgi:hypothetical protein
MHILTPVDTNACVRSSPENDYAQYKQRMRNAAQYKQRNAHERTSADSPSDVAGFFGGGSVVVPPASQKKLFSPSQEGEPHLTKTVANCVCERRQESTAAWHQALGFYDKKRATLVLRTGMQVIYTKKKMTRLCHFALQNDNQLQLQPHPERTNRFARAPIITLNLTQITQVWAMFSEREDGPRQMCIVREDGVPIIFTIDGSSNRQLQLLVCLKRLAPAASAVFDLGEV